MNNHYNTTNLKGDELKEKNHKAGKQADKILKYFKRIKQPMTPSDIHLNLFDESTPLTSVRRAITTLTNRDEVLVKTENQKIGIYGSKEYYWKLK